MTRTDGISLDPSVKRLLERLAALNPPGARTPTIDERRAALKELLGLSSAQAVARVEKVTLPGLRGTLRARTYTPAGAQSVLLPGLIYFHGGGLVAGCLDSHDAICRSLSNASGARLVSVDYRLAPEHRFPAAVEDAYAAVCWIAERPGEFGIDADHLMVGGDSAGATLAAVVGQMDAAAHPARLAAQILLCPILDHGAEMPSRRAFRRGFFLEEEMLDQDLALYLGAGADRLDPRISPLRAPSVDNVPPACIHTAECDPMRDEGAAYAERLQLAGVRVLYRCHPGMIHLFYGIGALIPYAAQAYELLGSDIRSVLQGATRTDRPWQTVSA